MKDKEQRIQIQEYRKDKESRMKARKYAENEASKEAKVSMKEGRRAWIQR